MKVTFVSNYINHHQLPFSGEMYARLGEDYRFIQVEPMEEERVSMGWAVEVGSIPYLLLYYEEKALCDRLLLESDIVIFGGTDREDIIQPRLKTDRITIRNSERLYREGQWKAISPRGLCRKYADHTQYRSRSVYLLCCGGYVASDFHLVRAYPDKMLKWGYFPETRKYEMQELPNEHKTDCVELMWAGRFLELKHPEYALLAAQRLRQKGISFHLTMIGDGEQKPAIERKIREKQLQDVITLSGFQRPERVRDLMEQSHVFLFTSNRLEGWGAVLNESMNSGLAVVANHAIGAVPFLLRHGENGLVYQDGNTEEFLDYVEQAAADGLLRRKLGRNAYHTIADEWNAQNGAECLLHFCENLLQGKTEYEAKGPCSAAEVIALRKGYDYVRK